MPRIASSRNLIRARTGGQVTDILSIDEHEAKEWREGLGEFDAPNELIAFGIMAALTKPASWLDVGCGTGAIVKTALHNLVDAFGVDQLAEDSDRFMRVDLRLPLDLKRTFALVSCIEVAEHLQPEYEGVICDTLARHVQVSGGILVFTAAKPGQSGYNHFNCQSKEYWHDRLESRGLKYDYVRTMRLGELWRQTWTQLHHLEENLQVFTR